MQYLGELPSIHTSTDLSVNLSGSLSIILSLSAEKLWKIPSNNGEKHTVNYLHETPVKSPSVHTSYGKSVIPPICVLSIPSICTSCVMSVIAPIHASSIQAVHTLCIMSVVTPIHALSEPSVHLSDDEHQEFPDEFPGNNYGEKTTSEIMVKIPDNITLTLHQAKFLEETPGTTNGVKYLTNFLVTQKWVKFMVINIRNYVLGVFHIASHTMQCVHGSIAKIFWNATLDLPILSRDYGTLVDQPTALL